MSRQPCGRYTYVPPGNPFFLTELLSSLGGETTAADLLSFMPASAREVVSQRLSDLPYQVRRVLEVCAVIGTEVDLGLLDGVLAEAGSAPTRFASPSAARCWAGTWPGDGCVSCIP